MSGGSAQGIVRLYDATGVPLTATTAGAKRALDVVIYSSSGAIAFSSSNPGRSRDTDLTASGTITGSGQTVTLTDLSGHGAVTAQVTGTFVASLLFELSVDGTNFTYAYGFPYGSANWSGSSAAPGIWRFNVAAVEVFRVRATTYTSGTATVTLRASHGGYAENIEEQILNRTSLNNIDLWTGTAGAANPSRIVFVGGSDGTNARRLKTDSAGELQVDVLTSPLPTDAATLTEQQTQTASLSVLDDWDESDRCKTNTILKPTTTGGLTIFRSIDLDETEEEIKSSAGHLYGWYLYNATSSTIYVKFYNASAASVTVGTTTPVLTLPVPAYSAANAFTDIGIVFSTAITFAATTGVADSDTGAPADNALIANAWYA